MVAAVSQEANVRRAPDGLSPALVERLLALIGGDDIAEAQVTIVEAASPRQRLGAPSATKAPALPIHPLQRTSEALAFLRRSSVSASVAESTVFGTRWWVSDHPHPLDAAAIIALATKMGF